VCKGGIGEGRTSGGRGAQTRALGQHERDDDQSEEWRKGGEGCYDTLRGSGKSGQERG